VKTYDAIVLGCGAVGSAALYELAKRGRRVVGLDQFGSAHDRGSSHGQTRMIRKAYFEHPDYVPLAEHAYRLWEELSAERRQTLLLRSGLLQVGPADGPVVQGVLASAERFGLNVERFSAAEAESRWPQFRFDPSHCVVYEAEAGCLLVESCIQSHLELAARRGAELCLHSPANSWQVDGDGIAVETDRGRFRADRLIVAAGAWSGAMLAELNVGLEIRRKPFYWFEAVDRRMDRSAGCPAYLFDLPEGIYYGMPRIDRNRVKVARHDAGESVAHPADVSRKLDAADQANVSQFVERRLPLATTGLLDHGTCLYTMTRDEHFIVDRHPQHPQVLIAAGLSGHGFKFSGVLGQALADLAIEGGTKLPIDFLSLARFA
jgi:monomeric sarcosine oxidase